MQAAMDTVSMAICQLLLASILTIADIHVSEAEEEAFIARCHAFAVNFAVGDHPPQPPRSFRRLWDARCLNEWRTAYCLFSISRRPTVWKPFGPMGCPYKRMTSCCLVQSFVRYGLQGPLQHGLHYCANHNDVRGHTQQIELYLTHLLTFHTSKTLHACHCNSCKDLR